MARRTRRQWLTSTRLTFLTLPWGRSFSPVTAPKQSAQAHEELTRKSTTQVAAVYPDVARRMSISGTVKVLVVVAPNGNLKSTKVVGGHPLLVNAAMDAIKKWKFEPAPEESTGIVEFKFQPQD